MVSVIGAVAAAGLGAVSPTREEFRELAVNRRVIPVTRKLLADAETPVGLYRKLGANQSGTFLFESAENGRSWSRWSFIGVRSSAALTATGGEAFWTGGSGVGLPAGGDAMKALRETIDVLLTQP